MNPNIFRVAEFVLGKALYTDYPLTKQAVADAFDVKRPSIWRYDKTVFYLVQEYREDYPLLPNDIELIKKKGCRRDRGVLLTPYQVWVISLIRGCFIYFGKEATVKDYIRANKYLFSKAKYEAHLRKIATVANQKTA